MLHFKKLLPTFILLLTLILVACGDNNPPAATADTTFSYSTISPNSEYMDQVDRHSQTSSEYMDQVDRHSRSNSEYMDQVDRHLPKTQPMPKLLPSIYTTRLTAEDVYSLDPRFSKAEGSWQVQLAEDGSFSAELAGQLSYQGYYTLQNDLVTFSGGNWPASSRDLGDMGHRQLDNQGVYRWTFSQNSLSLSLVSETSELRSRVLLTHPLVRLTQDKVA